MVTEKEIREHFGAKSAEYSQRIKVVEARLSKARADEKPDAAEVARLEEKLVHLKINVRDCEAKVANAAVVAARRSAPQGKGTGKTIAPAGIDSTEKMGRIGG